MVADNNADTHSLNGSVYYCSFLPSFNNIWCNIVIVHDAIFLVKKFQYIRLVVLSLALLVVLCFEVFQVSPSVCIAL